jgi:hypothetical protein
MSRPDSTPLVLEHVAATGFQRPASHAEHRAFWINAYNRLVRQGIVAFGLRHSVWEVSDFFDRISIHVAWPCGWRGEAGASSRPRRSARFPWRSPACPGRVEPCKTS